MSTRSRTRSGVMVKDSTTISQTKPKSRGPPQNQSQHDMDVDSDDGKENPNMKTSSNLSTTTVHNKKSKSKKGKTRDSLASVDCVCRKGDDGSPMIYCAECKIWYHFTCVDLSEPEAEEINIYICPTCTVSTRRRSAMTWEGDQAIEECTDDETSVVTRRKAAVKTRKRSPESKFVAEESEESLSSEDEYVEGREEHVGKNAKRNAHLRRISTISDTESVDDTRKRRLSRVKISPSPSPPPYGHPNLKRKATYSNASQPSPAQKRKRSADNQTATDDPARKYCLGKLEELFRDVFLRYPHVSVPTGGGDEEHDMDVESETGEGRTKVVHKKLEELSDDEKDAVITEANQFAKDLESCVFELYSESDKAGHPHPGGKYKERFRMLQFNLSKVDRVIIHQRITSGIISAKEISLMSSTDLADEETKQSIKLAEKEALEHSILLKSSAPRAKITHKGLQDIEDVNGEVATAREIERLNEREQEEEERRERERMARLRTVQRQRTASVSLPPESPIQRSPIIEQKWGAPPPVPPHAMSPRSDEVPVGITRPPLFLQSSSDINSEPELNLADLINIDEEQEPTRASTHHQPMTGSDLDPNFTSSPVDMLPPSTNTGTPTGISPFAARQDRSRGASFDLNSLWNGPKEESVSSAEPSAEIIPPPTSNFVKAPPVEEGSDKDDAMDLESVEANDQDFDMFLDENQPESPSDLIVTPIPLKEVERLPQVWTGKITMPLDSSVPQETTLVARQVAGRTLAPDSPLWRTLFPSEQLRIEGRVPVENSIKYLLQMRMNATKELYAAAFVPASPSNAADFKTFCNFLISKSRHGLVFPWGSRPKDYHPGRELYMIPLLESDPLPEFVELLDELKLPKTRSNDYLLGIWILNKGKLAPLPGALPVQPQPTQHTQTPPVNIPMYTPPPSAPQMSHLGTTPNQPPPLPMPMQGIAHGTLAAEVASLTPEQLQEVLRTLVATTQMSLPPHSAPGHIPQGLQPLPGFGPAPPVPSHAPPSSLTQPWMQPPPPGSYPMNYPPPNVPFQQPPRLNSPAQPLYERQEHDRDFRPGPHYTQGQGNRGNHNERGWRGGASNRGGNRGRGRGGEDFDRDFNSRRQSDSGWPRRPRNEGGW